jgi:hypothetical protein
LFNVPVQISIFMDMRTSSFLISSGSLVRIRDCSYDLARWEMTRLIYYSATIPAKREESPVTVDPAMQGNKFTISQSGNMPGFHGFQRR